MTRTPFWIHQLDIYTQYRTALHSLQLLHWILPSRRYHGTKVVQTLKAKQQYKKDVRGPKKMVSKVRL